MDRLHAYIPPGYVVLVYISLLIHFSIGAIQVGNLILLQAANYTLFLLFKEVTTERAALLGLVFISAYIPLWLLAACIDPNSLNLLLIAITLLLLHRIYSSHGTGLKYWVGMGIVLAIQLLVRPDTVIGISCMLLLVVSYRTRISNLLRGAAIISGISLAVLSPWILRNSIVFHQFIPLSSNAGYNLFVGNNDGASGEIYYMITDSASKQLREYAAQKDQPTFDRYLLHIACAWIEQHPLLTIQNDLKKLILHWMGRELSRPGFQETRVLLYSTNLLLLLLGAIGIASLRDRFDRDMLLLLFLYSSIVSMLFFVQTRHKLIKCDPCLLYLSAYAITILWTKLKRRIEVRSKAGIISCP